MYGFSRNDGQIYKETSAPVRSMVRTWTKNSRGKKTSPSLFYNRGPGVSSLFDAAIRSCRANADLFTPDTLQYYSWELCKPVYKHMKETETFTVSDWSNFRSAFPLEFREDYDLRESQKNNTRPELVGSFIRKIATFTFPSSTFLCIRGFDLRPSDFVELYNFPSLTVLILEQRSIASYCVEAQNADPVDEAFLRRWARNVREAGKIPNLKIIILRGFNWDYQSALEALSNLPNLCLCNLHTGRCGPYTAIDGGGKWKYLQTPSQDKIGEEADYLDDSKSNVGGSSESGSSGTNVFQPGSFRAAHRATSRSETNIVESSKSEEDRRDGDSLAVDEGDRDEGDECFRSFGEREYEDFIGYEDCQDYHDYEDEEQAAIFREEQRREAQQFEKQQREAYDRIIYADRHPLGIVLERKDLTVSQKMKQLYDESTKIGESAAPTVDRDPTVSIDYCGPTDRPFSNSYKYRSIWFQRLLPPSPPSIKPDESQKRARGSTISQDTNTKKTKLQMRQTKQKDIGSILDMF
ncbi:hypothetical protein BDV96DRAFT_593848 [Lophiotrema nucula]|uniref:Uncharacterized protein n=1 Tax=Lophiotrema nucula TaxID=690887 RepID=A0A6A5ZUK1_9PLEO|nr:hypothetical protein BDV96DRAFT_593848 [Lophiotrema nucula]